MTSIERAKQWVTSPSEIARLARALPQLFFRDFDNSKFCPNYTKDSKVGVVIGTYGSVPYIDLQLHFLKNVNHIEHVLVFDDCSEQRDNIKSICSEYGAEFITPNAKLPYLWCLGTNGDTASFLCGIEWGKKNNLDVVVKLSRRLVPCCNWIDNFKQLMVSSQAVSFSSYCEKDPFHLRTECVGMNIEAWSNDYILNSMKWCIANDFLVFAEFWFHELSKLLSYNNISEKWLEFNKQQDLGYIRSGYAVWKDLLGTNRYTTKNRLHGVLWHEYSKPEDYFNIAKEIFGNKYTLNCFNA